MAERAGDYGTKNVPGVRLIPLTYVKAESQSSSIKDNIEFVRFTDGVTSIVRSNLPFKQGPIAERKTRSSF